MITGVITVLHRSLGAACVALLFCLLVPHTGSAQQYLGNARQKCPEPVTVTAQGTSMQVRQFESRSVEVRTTTLNVQCGGRPLPDVQCPANTNKVLIDRSQGGSVFSIICLQK
jgi:hypothetical protein